MNIKWLEKIKPDYQTTDNYQHGFHDAIQVVMDKLLSEQKENSAGVVNLSNVVRAQFPYLIIHKGEVIARFKYPITRDECIVLMEKLYKLKFEKLNEKLSS